MAKYEFEPFGIQGSSQSNEPLLRDQHGPWKEAWGSLAVSSGLWKDANVAPIRLIG